MQLPEINYGPVQDEASGAIARAGAAAQEFGDTLERGFTSMGQALVQTQTADANLKLSKDLAALDQEIRSKRAFSQEELKGVLGEKYDALPEAIRNQPDEPVLDEKGGPVMSEYRPGEPPRPVVKTGDVPAWMVGHEVFQHKAQQALDEAAKHITVSSGWANKFRRAAAADVIAKGAAISEHLGQQALAHQQNARVRQINEYANAGDFNMARVVADGSLDVLGQEGVSKAHAMIGAAQQERPVNDALIGFRTDADAPGVEQNLKAAAAALADERKTGLLHPEKRASMASAVAAALKSIDEGHQKRDAAGIALVIIQDSQDPIRPGMVDAPSAGKKLDEAFKPGGRFASKPELYFEAQALLGRTISERNAAAKQSFDNVGAAAISEYLSIDAAGNYHPSSSHLSTRTRAALNASGKDGQDLLKQMLDWDRQAEAQARSNRNQPTDAEAGRAFLIERSITMNPGAWRQLSGPDQLKVMAGLAPVPGEPDAPAVPVSARDVPSLSQKLAVVSGAIKPQYVTDPGKIAREEAEKAYPVLKNPKARSPEATTALRGLSDKLAAYIDGERNLNGKEPPQDAIRKEAQRLMATVEVRDTFLWVFPSKKKTTRIVAEGAKLDYTEPGAPAAPAPPAATPAPPPPRPPGAVVKGEDIGQAPGTEWVKQPNGKLKRVK